MGICAEVFQSFPKFLKNDREKKLAKKSPPPPPTPGGSTQSISISICCNPWQNPTIRQNATKCDNPKESIDQ